ncbi:MAG: tetratricopeptide repeat protein [Phycisphaerae bacterium]|nr:tetratricopeptide repeat protein [Phycisphaerae bacterium]
MRVYMLITAGLLAALIAGSSSGKQNAKSIRRSENQSRPVNWEKGRQERKLCRDLSKTVISWLSDANDSAAIECERLADSLLGLEEPGVRSYFIAAQVARLRQKSEKAISILEDVISKYPDETAPIGMHVPVKIVGHLWIATIAKQSGDMAKAKNVYETILTMLESPKKIEGLEDKGGLMMICNLYLAETESLHLKRNDLALGRLEAIERIKKPAGQLGAGYDIYKGWAAYQHTKMSKGRVQAAQHLIAHPEMISASLLALTHLDLCGLIGAPLNGLGNDKRINIVAHTLVDQIVQNAISPIDTSLVRLGYGFDQQYKGKLAKAEKYYSALLEEDTFFSPVAGIYLAMVKEAKGNTAEAEATLERLKTKYPGYKSEAAKVEESWKKNTEKLKM